jgi:hypothetical protein
MNNFRKYLNVFFAVLFVFILITDMLDSITGNKSPLWIICDLIIIAYYIYRIVQDFDL